MSFLPVQTRARWIALGVVTAGVAACGVTLYLAFANGIGPRTVGWGAAFAVLLMGTMRLAYWSYGLFNMHYALSRDALVIRWAATRQVVPMGAITHVVKGRPYQAPLVGVRWDGYEVGHTTILDDAGLTALGLRAAYPLTELEPDVRRSMEAAAALLRRTGQRIAHEETQPPAE